MAAIERGLVYRSYLDSAELGSMAYDAVLLNLAGWVRWRTRPASARQKPADSSSSRTTSLLGCDFIATAEAAAIVQRVHPSAAEPDERVSCLGRPETAVRCSTAELATPQRQRAGASVSGM